jgi:hypothetical protein
LGIGRDKSDISASFFLDSKEALEYTPHSLVQEVVRASTLTVEE